MVKFEGAKFKQFQKCFKFFAQLENYETKTPVVLLGVGGLKSHFVMRRM